MRHLPDVTLVCCDCVDPILAVRALEYSRRGLSFASVVLFSHERPANLPGDIEYREVGRFSKYDYNKFCIEELHRHIETSHALTIQVDGFVLRPTLWEDAWLQYDYVGAPWPKFKRFAQKCRIGNSGCCLRSKRLLEETARLSAEHPEWKWHGSQCYDDVFVGHIAHECLLAAGMKFPSIDTAARFAVYLPVEGWDTPERSFAFHGKVWPEYCSLIASDSA